MHDSSKHTSTKSKDNSLNKFSHDMSLDTIVYSDTSLTHFKTLKLVVAFSGATNAWLVSYKLNFPLRCGRAGLFSHDMS